MKFELKRRGRELRFELRPRLVIWLILMVLFAIDTELKHSCAVYLLIRNFVRAPEKLISSSCEH